MVRRRELRPSAGTALVVLLVALVGTGGSLTGPLSGAPTAWIDVAGILAGGGALAAAIIAGPLTRGRGTLTLGLFGAVVVLGGISILWSVAPDTSWEEAGRAAAYLGAFGAAAMLARSGRITAPALLRGLTWGLTGLATWALAVKLLGLGSYDQPDYGPLLSPFGYWNATGVIGAMALPGLVWIAAGRGGSRLARGLAIAAITLSASVVLLTYSRSATAAAIIAALAPLPWIAGRRRAAAALALAVLGGLPIWLVGLSNQTLSGDTQNSIYGGAVTIARGGAERELLIIVLVVLILLTGLGALLAGRLDRGNLPARPLRLYDRALRAVPWGVLALIILWLLLNARGPFGEISHLWHALTSVKGTAVGGRGNRLTSVANSRSTYWRQALAVGEHHPLAGTGLGSFDPAYLRYPPALLSPNQLIKHAHSYVFDTFAGLGLIGIGLNAALLLAWIRDVHGALRRPPAPNGRADTAVDADAGGVDTTEADRERDARWALLATVLAFGVSASLDWTFSFPGVAVGAMLAAGWLTGARPLDGTGPTPVAAGRPRRLSTRPGAILALTLLALVTLGVAWESLGPMRANQSIADSETAAIAGQGGAALTDARAATSEDPVSAAAEVQLAEIERATGHPAAELAALRRSTQVGSGDPEPWYLLGGHLLCHHERGAAVVALAHAAMLDLTDLSDPTGPGAHPLLASARSGPFPPASTCRSFP